LKAGKEMTEKSGGREEKKGFKNDGTTGSVEKQLPPIHFKPTGRRVGQKYGRHGRKAGPGGEKFTEDPSLK